MPKIKIALVSMLLMAAGQAMGQSVPGKVGGAVSGLENTASQATGGAVGGTPSNLNLSTTSNVGGELPGGLPVKMGDKTIQLRGNVGVGQNSGNAKAGVGVPF